MSSSLDSVRAAYSAMTLANDYIKRGLDAGKISKESQLAEIERDREEGMKTVTPTYGSRRKLVEPHTDDYFVSKDSSGKIIRINIMA